MASLDAVLRKCSTCQDFLRKRAGSMRSLGPGRGEATRLEVLARRLLREEDGAEVVEAFGEGLCEIAAAQVEHFPDTLFWDMDHVAQSLYRAGGAEEIAALGAQIAALQAQFGRHSALSFRYTHDFVYGYDWARWVRAAPEARAGVGPFDRAFVAYLSGRGEELVSLIEADDAKYGRLEVGEVRNPFSFSRTLAHEGLLLETLAARGLIPVQTWRLEGEARWEEDFAGLRAGCARELGLPGPGAGEKHGVAGQRP